MKNVIYIFFQTRYNYSAFKCLFITFVIAEHEDLKQRIFEGISNAVKLKFMLRQQQTKLQNNSYFQLEKLEGQFLIWWQLTDIHSRENLKVFYFRIGDHQKSDNYLVISGWIPVFSFPEKTQTYAHGGPW